MNEQREKEIEQYLHEHIPLSKAMQVVVKEVSETHVLLSAPLAPNINHRETVFGGSASAVAILAGWSLIHSRLRRESSRPRLVIQRNTMEYEQAIVGDFQARAELKLPEQWNRFFKILSRKKRARLKIPAILICGKETVASFEGEFVAIDDQV